MSLGDIEGIAGARTNGAVTTRQRTQSNVQELPEHRIGATTHANPSVAILGVQARQVSNPATTGGIVS